MQIDRASAKFHPRRFAKHVVYLVIASFLAHTFLAYFVGWEQVQHWVFGSPGAHPVGFGIVTMTTIAIMLDFVYFREQTCAVACPYGRWQSALLDNDSLIVALRLRARRAARQAQGPHRQGPLRRLRGVRHHLPDGHRHPQRPADGVHPLHPVHGRLRRGHAEGRHAARAHSLHVARRAGRQAAGTSCARARCSTPPPSPSSSAASSGS